MNPIKPRTNPNARTVREMSKTTDKFFRQFSPAFLSEKTGIATTLIACHKSRGKISAQAADAYCKIEQVKAAGFTRESLRPDIVNWYGGE